MSRAASILFPAGCSNPDCSWRSYVEVTFNDFGLGYGRGRCPTCGWSMEASVVVADGTVRPTIGSRDDVVCENGHWFPDSDHYPGGMTEWCPTCGIAYCNTWGNGWQRERSSDQGKRGRHYQLIQGDVR